MNGFKTSNWVSICLFNLLIVASIGVLMRYKTAFEFPFFSQKNLQYAHSHFAFGAWISLMLMVLMVDSVKNKLDANLLRLFHSMFVASLITSFGVLISFGIEGYGLFSITLSTISMLLSFWFSWRFFILSQKK